MLGGANPFGAGSLLTSISNGAFTGFVHGVVNHTADSRAIFKSTALSGLSAAFSYSIAEHYGHSSHSLSKSLSHGISQGVISQLRGSSFQDGFIGGLISSAAASSVQQSIQGNDWNHIAMRTAIVSLASGLAAQALGADPYQAAYTAAFVHLYNAEMDWINKKGGRKIIDGPTNGNWGGKCWSGGQYSCNGNPIGNKVPLDSADEAYMQHDLCYDCGTDKKICDEYFVNSLNNLDSDPMKWDNAPSIETLKDTRWYIIFAIEWFTE